MQQYKWMEAIWRCCNGLEAKAVPGTGGHVLGLLLWADIKCWCGQSARAVPTTVK